MSKKAKEPKAPEGDVETLTKTSAAIQELNRRLALVERLLVRSGRFNL